ncbi:regulatory protein YcgZ [Klebsiella oxytoca]|uniref:regulatory protein YcgZ n=1 Tax=Klebsiella oxytoca TaxID=571 RepID=UPI001CCF746C|nr:regulatory protein YcgZ [Klebsiella oxytoca]MBZ7309078.1 two-component-system connector protein YcgZ [Klebsiella oxytoca]
MPSKDFCNSEQAITSYFKKARLPTQQETLGLIVSEILTQDQKLSRLAICTKLLRRAELASSEEEIAHYNTLIALIFSR